MLLDSIWENKMKARSGIILILFAVFCIFFIIPWNYIIAQDKPVSKEPISEGKELKKEPKIPLTEEDLKIIEDLIRELEWLYEHGLGRTDRAKRLEAALKELLKKLLEEYEKKCQGTKAQSEYCKKLADIISRLKQVLGLEERNEDTNRPKSLQKSPGGVYMAPQPESAGKGGSEVRDEILKSKPSGDSLSWPVPIKEK